MTDAPLSIRAFEPADWPRLWPILRATFARGDTYALPPDIDEAAAFELWVARPRATFVACDAAGAPIGSYYLKPNQAGGGDHVANAGYVVDPAARGRGVASRLCVHSQDAARALGFSAMQFNFVVSTNDGAVRLWRRHGFEIVGTLPRAFRHPQAGLVDAYVMYKPLAAGAGAA